MWVSQRYFYFNPVLHTRMEKKRTCSPAKWQQFWHKMGIILAYNWAFFNVFWHINWHSGQELEISWRFLAYLLAFLFFMRGKYISSWNPIIFYGNHR